MKKSFNRWMSAFLSLILFLNIIPIPTFAEGVFGAGGDIVVDASPSVTLPPVSSGDAADEVAGKEEAGKEEDPIPTFDHLYADESVVEGIDFSTKRLLVGAADASVFTWDTVVRGEYNGVYLLEFDTELSARSAYTYYRGKVSFVDADIVIDAAADGFIGATPTDIWRPTDNPLSRVSDLIAAWQNGSRPHYDVALIDTGASGAAGAVSVIGDSVEDDNGHGSAMLSAMTGLSDELSVLSIKALDGSGHGTVTSVYAAIQYAVACGVDVICLPMAAESRVSVSALSRAVSRARGAGITVVAAAGNGGTNTSRFIPASISGVIVAGACDATGVRLPQSNDGVYCNVVAASTSEASAKLSALIAAQGIDALDDMLNHGLIFAADYIPAEEEEPTEEPEEEPAEEEPTEEPEEEPTEEPTEDKVVLYIYGDEDLMVLDDDVPQGSVSRDNVTIQKVTVRWLTVSDGGDSPAGTDRLELSPDGDKVKNQQFQIDFSVTGQNVFEPGEIQLEIPAYLWENRDGEKYGELSLAIPQAPDEGAEFVWTRSADGSKIIITNNKQISSSSKVLIQGSFRNMEAYMMEDGTVSDKFSATLTVRTPAGNDLSMSSNSIDAEVHTKVSVTEAGKTAYDPVKKAYSIWWDEVPDIPQSLKDNLPEGADPADYVYVRWYVDASAAGNQPYTMWFEDSIDANDAENLGGIMLGATNTAEGAVPAENGKVTANLYVGHDTTVKTAYVWTAYPREKLQAYEDSGEQIVFHNRQDTYVQGDDQDEDEITTARAETTVPTKMPTKYTFVKHWEDNNNALGVRPTYLDLDIYDENHDVWRTVRLREKDATDGNGNDWTYTWSDEGMGTAFTVAERMNASGILGELFNENGIPERWWYYLDIAGDGYDLETHTWTYVNRLTTSRDGIEPISTIDKKVVGHDDPQLISTDDVDLNRLLHDIPAEVTFTVRTSIAAAMLSKEGGVSPNRFALEDGTYFLNDNKDLTDKDIDISGLTIGNVVVWKYLDPPIELPNGQIAYDREAVDPRPDVEIYGLMGGDWTLMATLRSDGNVDPVNGASVTFGRRINLPAGVSRVRVQVECEYQIVDIRYDVYLRINPTDTIKGLVEAALADADYIRFRLDNTVFANVTYIGQDEVHYDGRTFQPNETLINMNVTDTGYLHGKDYKVATDLQKAFYMVDNEALKSKRLLQLHSTLTLTQQSNITVQPEYVAALAGGDIPNTTSGYYYDLLPYGVDPDLGSITLSGGDIVTNVWTVPNYKDSGRTLLVVKVKMTNNYSLVGKTDKSEQFPGSYPEAGYRNVHTLDFDAYVSYDVTQSMGLDYMHNVAAYEADESQIGSYDRWSGEPDDPTVGNNTLSGNAVGEDAQLMKGLHGDRNDPSFVYAGAPLTYEEVNYSARTSLYKDVLVPGTGRWETGQDNSVNVEEDGNYVYRIMMTSDNSTKNKDLIFLDVLEAYLPTDIDKDAGDTKRWRGSLVSVDVAQMVQVGAAPKIYYTTKEGLDVSGYNPGHAKDVVGNILESGTDGWTTTRPDDMSKVTGVAIDVRMGKDGEPFVLAEGATLIAHLYMRAPYDDVPEGTLPEYLTGDGTDHLKNWHAYNEVYYDVAQEDENQDTARDYNKYSYTKVGIYSKYFDIYKVWDDADDTDGKRPGSLTVELMGDDEPLDPPRTITIQATDDEKTNWHGKFIRLKTYNDKNERIVYSVVERSNDLAHQDLDDQYTLTIIREDKSDHAEVRMINIHEPEKIKLPVTKIWDDENSPDITLTRPGRIAVTLYANGVNTGKTLYLQPDSWYGEFTDLNKYYDHGKLVDYTIVEEFVDDYATEYTEPEGEDNYDWTITNIYYPHGDLKVAKRLQDATPAAEAGDSNEFTFHLTLTTAEGVAVIEQYPYTIYDKDGNEQSKGEIGNGGSFKLRGDWYIVIKDIDTHIQYTVTEESHNVFTQAGGWGDKGEILTGTAEAEFINRYASSGFADIRALKTLTGRALGRFQFRFELERLNEDGTGTGNIITAFNEADGTVTFGRLEFTNADDDITYTYALREVIAGKPGYTYDDTVYTVKVTPHDNGNGTMTCDVQFFDGDGEPLETGNMPEFLNKYEAEGEYLVRGWKTLDVRALEAEEFTFALYKYDPDTGSLTQLKTTKNTAEGTFTFDALKYTEEDIDQTYYYFIRELFGNDPTVKYDGSIFCYSITVIDNGDGTLSFDSATYDVTESLDELLCETCGGSGWVVDENAGRHPEYPNEPVLKQCEACEGRGVKLELAQWTAPDPNTTAKVVPVIRNGLKDGALSVSKYTEADSDPDKVFRFKLKIIGEDVDDFEFVYEKNPATGEDESVWEKVYEEHPELSPEHDTNGANSGAKIGAVAASVSRADQIATVIDDYPVALAVGDLVAQHGGKYDDNSTGFRGASGKQIIWTVCKDGTLVFEPADGVYGQFDFGSSQSSTGMPWYGYRNNITYVVAEAGVDLGSNAPYLFYGCTELLEADLSKATGNLASSSGGMSGMFSGCTKLKKVNFGDNIIGGYRGLIVTAYYYVFFNCTSLEQVYFGQRFFNNNVQLILNAPTEGVDANGNQYTGKWMQVEKADNGGPSNKPTGLEIEQNEFTKAKWETGPYGGWWVWGIDISQYTIDYLFDENSPSTRQDAVSINDDHVFANPPGFVNFGWKLVGWKDKDHGDEYRFDDETGMATIPKGRYEKGDAVSLIPIWEKDTGGITTEDGEYGFELRGGESITFTGIPAGTAYQVWEETDDGWIKVAEVDSSGVIQPLETAKASFYNLYRANIEAVDFSGSKTFNGTAGAGFEFELWEADAAGNPQGAKPLQTKVSGKSGVFQFDPIYYGMGNLGSHYYVILEKAGSDRTIHYDTETKYLVKVEVTDNGDGSITAVATYPNGTPAFSNYTIPGSLEITKEITEPDWADDAWRALVANTEFTFKVRLKNANSTPVDDGKTYSWKIKDSDPEVRGEVTTSDGGYVTVQCKAGETIVFPGLPAGMKYEIEEINMPTGWTWDGEHSSNMQGVIPAVDPIEATMVNTYSVKGDIVLGTHKWFDGNVLETGQFEFELWDEDKNELLFTARNSAVDKTEETTEEDDAGNVTTVPNLWKDSAPVTFGAITYAKPGVYHYRIHEVNNGIPKVAYDDVDVYVTVTVTDNGDGTLSAEAEYTKGTDPNRTAEFRNGMEPGDLEVKKTLRNATTTAAEVGEFTFRIEVWESKESMEAGAPALTSEFVVEKSDGTTTAISGTNNTVTIKGGESFVVKDLPHDAYYVVTELDTEGFTQLTDECKNTAGNIVADDTQYAEFINVYQSFGAIILGARKTLDADEGSGIELEEGMFTFVLKDADGNVISTAKNKADGSVEFPELVFTDEQDGKTLYYYISEQNDGDERFYYDPHSEMVILELSDDGKGHMSYTVTYEKADAEQGEVPEFINGAGDQKLTISKKVTGGMGNLTEAFTFALTLSNDTYSLPSEIDYAKNDGTTGTLTPNKSKEYVFTLRHGETIELLGLPRGTSYTVTEAESDYVTTITVGADETIGKTVEGALDDDVSVSYVNRLDGAVPTGVALALSWLIPMMTMALAGVLWLMLRRRRTL